MRIFCINILYVHDGWISDGRWGLGTGLGEVGAELRYLFYFLFLILLDTADVAGF